MLHPKRYLDLLSAAPASLASGLRTRLREGYGGRDLRADLMAGLVVGVVALPLSMALAIASGVAPLVAYLPMAALAALLLVVAKNMSEVRHFLHITRVAPRSDVVVLVTCFLLTVVFDMVVAVSVGIVLAALLFMRRMAEISEAKLVDPSAMVHFDLPPGVRMYEIAGPLFFGAAEKAMGVFHDLGSRRETIILVLAKVPIIDATGLVALETVLGKLRRAGHKVVLTGLQKQPAETLARAGIERVPGRLAIVPDINNALSVAILHGSRLTHTNPGFPVPDAPEA